MRDDRTKRAGNRDWFLIVAVVVLGVLSTAAPASAQSTDPGIITEDLGDEFELVKSAIIDVQEPDTPTGWTKHFSSDDAFVTITAHDLSTNKSATDFAAGMMNGFQESLNDPITTEYPGKENIVQIVGQTEGIDIAAAFYIQDNLVFLVTAAQTTQPALSNALDTQLAHFDGELSRLRTDESDRVESANNAYAAGRATGAILFYGLLLAGFIALIRWGAKRNGGEPKTITFANPPDSPPPAPPVRESAPS